MATDHTSLLADYLRIPLDACVHLALCVHACVCVCESVCVCVCMCIGCQVPVQSNRSCAVGPHELTCSQKQRDMKTERKASLCSTCGTVCLDPVWGLRLSADSNELPWEHTWVAGVPKNQEGVREGRFLNQYTHAYLHRHQYTIYLDGKVLEKMSITSNMCRRKHVISRM